MRGLGVSTVLADAPDLVVLLFALLTQLGDAWFLFVSLALLYWFGPSSIAPEPRRAGAYLVALVFGALLLTLSLKAAFALPRPPGAAVATAPNWLPDPARPLVADFTTGYGYGFPSGHALGTTVAYGGMATLYRVWSRRRRALLAAAVVATVSLSRLVLGVHYLGDVVAGVAVGLTFLAAMRRLTSERPGGAFAVAAALGVVALGVAVATGYTEGVHDAAAGLGGSLGGLIGWRFAGDTDRAVSAPPALLALVVTGGLWGATAAFEPALPVAVALGLASVSGIVALPGLLERWTGRTQRRPTRGT